MKNLPFVFPFNLSAGLSSCDEHLICLFNNGITLCVLLLLGWKNWIALLHAIIKLVTGLTTSWKRKIELSVQATVHVGTSQQCCTRFFNRKGYCLETTVVGRIRRMKGRILQNLLQPHLLVIMAHWLVALWMTLARWYFCQIFICFYHIFGKDSHYWHRFFEEAGQMEEAIENEGKNYVVPFTCRSEAHRLVYEQVL